MTSPFTSFPIATTAHGAITAPADIHESFHYVSGSDPGAVGAGKRWLDTSVVPYQPYRRNGTNTGWIAEAARGVHVDPRDFGAVFDGVTNDTTAINAAITAANAAGGGWVWIPGSAKVTTLQLKTGVQLIGGSPFTRASGSAKSRLIGTTGSNVIELPTSGSPTAMGVRHLKISGGLNGVVSTVVATYVTIEDVAITGPTGSCIYTEGQIEEWRLRDVYIEGGDYGFRHVNAGATSLVDKCTFENVTTDGQAVNGWRIESANSNTCTWINPIIVTANQHGFYADGGIRGWTFVNVNTEGNGHSGKSNRTTGTITSGTASLVVASATGYAIGDPITVAGAGSNGDDLTTVVDNIAGTTFTLHVNASTSVTAGKVTNAAYDDFHFAASIATSAGVQFFGGIIGGEGTGGHLRYALDASTMFRVLLCGLRASTAGIPVYDPTNQCTLMGAEIGVRQSPTVASRAFHVPSFPIPSSSEEHQRTVVPSPAGKTLLFNLVDANANGTGAVGNLEVRVADANRTLIFQIDGTTWDIIQNRSTGKLKAMGTAYIDPKANPGTCTKGELNVGTDGKLYVCSATNTWTVAGTQT